MPSQLSVWNRALFLLEMERASSTTPSNTATRTLNEAWQDTVEFCLEQGDFDCGKVRQALSQVSPAPAFGWTYYYAIPADSLRLVFVSETGLKDDRLLHFAIEDGKIATDATTVYVIFVSSSVITTPGKWSASLAEFIACMLAFRCLKLNPGARDAVEKALKMAKPVAESLDAVQNPPEFRRPGRWATSMRGSRNHEQGR